MKKSNKVAIATLAGLTTLAPFAANAHGHYHGRHGGAEFLGGFVGGIVGGAIANAVAQPRTVVVNQPAVTQTVVTRPVIRQQFVEQPVYQEVVEQPVEQVIIEEVPQTVEYVETPTTYTTTTYAQPAASTTVIMGTTPVVPFVAPLGRPFYRDGYHGFHGHPVPCASVQRGPVPHGGFHGGYYARPGNRHR